MGSFKSLMDEFIQKDIEFLKIHGNGGFVQHCMDYIGKVQAGIDTYQKTGKISFDEFKVNNTHLNPDIKLERHSAVKENVDPYEYESENRATEQQKRGRSKRTAAKEASESISQQSKISLNSRLQRGDVKIEKLSMLPKITETDSEIKIQEQIKVEAEEMPAPTFIPPAKKRTKKPKNTDEKPIKTERITRSKKRATKSVASDVVQSKKDSDVVVNEPVIEIIDISDSNESSDDNKLATRVTRSTRTKTIKKKMETVKRNRTNSSDDDEHLAHKNDKKRSKSNSSNEQNIKSNEEEEKTNLIIVNSTFITTSPINKNLEDVKEPVIPSLDATVVIEKPNVIVPDVEAKKKPTATKQIFSAFENSPVKKKVEAFEQLNNQASLVPIKITRTKTRAQAKEKAEGLEKLAYNEMNNEQPLSKIKETAKIFTPTSTKFLPGFCSTSKLNKHPASKGNESLSSARSASALKASQNEFREREKRRHEKEEEALRKKEAIISAQVEEKKRIREEKRLKAQKQREVLEENKLNSLEAQKIKEERHKQLLAEQEERKQKTKEEMERKRLLAKQRAIEEKKKEEERRIEEHKKMREVMKLNERKNTEKRKQLPVYMMNKPPFLPTPYCYDSDEPEYTQTQPKSARWARESELKSMQIIMFAAGENMKNTLFSCQAQTPDLQEIFETIDPRKLKRTSSAIWHKPPRYTLMPGLDEIEATFEEDEEDYE